MKKTKRFYIFATLLLTLLTCILAFTACNTDYNSQLPHEYFEGNCVTKGYTRYYMPNGAYIDKEDDEFGNHSYNAEVISVLSCTEDGNTKYTCGICNDTYYDVVKHIGHVYDEKTIHAPTCTADGLKSLTCKNCDFSYNQTLDKLAHDYRQTSHSDATCTQSGYTNFICEVCGDLKTENIDKKEHSYTVLSQTTPTCSSQGVTVYKCSDCGTSYSETADKLNHEYSEEVLKNPTCTDEGIKAYSCKNCDYSYTQSIDMLNHSYTVAVIKEPSCTVEGETISTCKNCGHSEIQSVPTAPHTPNGQIVNNSEAHWQICEICNKICEYISHTYSVTHVAATCIDHAYTHNKCVDCDYYYDVTNVDSGYASHVYEAYVCNVCQRDELNDHLSDFQSKGTKNNLIEITSQKMLTIFYDFIILNEITEPKYFKVTYTTLTEETLPSFIEATLRTFTATNWSLKLTYTTNRFTKELLYLGAYAQDQDSFVFDEVATVTPNDYDAQTCVQYKSYQFSANDNERPSDFDSFKYNNRIYSLEVKSSDQLFYSFAHGYKPLTKNESAAQKVLDKAKAVARHIMNDTMSDLEKVRAIYSYLVSDVAYDYGVIEYTNTVPFAKCTSYYAEGVFDYGIAVCDGISKAFCILAGLEDIKCIRITSTNHAWNRVFIDINGDGNKTWHNVDATWANQSLRFDGERGEYLTVDDFLFNDLQKSANGQQAGNYLDTDADATDVVNPFEYFYFDDEETAENDYVISTDNELENLILYMKNNFNLFEKGDKVTVQIFIDSTYCSANEINATLTTALRKLWIAYSNASYSIAKTAYDYNGVTGYFTTIVITKING